MSEQEKPKYVSPTEFARYFGVDKMTIYRALTDERIKAIRFGKQWRIPVTEIERVEREGL